MAMACNATVTVAVVVLSGRNDSFFPGRTGERAICWVVTALGFQLGVLAPPV